MSTRTVVRFPPQVVERHADASTPAAAIAPGFAGTAIEIDFRPGIDVGAEGEEVF